MNIFKKLLTRWQKPVPKLTIEETKPAVKKPVKVKASTYRQSKAVRRKRKMRRYARKIGRGNQAAKSALKRIT